MSSITKILLLLISMLHIMKNQIQNLLQRFWEWNISSCFSWCKCLDRLQNIPQTINLKSMKWNIIQQQVYNIHYKSLIELTLWTLLNNKYECSYNKFKELVKSAFFCCHWLVLDSVLSTVVGLNINRLNSPQERGQQRTVDIGSYQILKTL